jgi:hypothetical protein
MQRVLFAIATLVAAMLVGSPVGAAEPIEAGPGPGAPAELTRVYSLILRDPTNSQLNLRYAELAEASGKLRWALAAYERVLVNDPGNLEAQAGLQRVRRRLQPNTTQFTAELGAAGETNPRYRDYIAAYASAWRSGITIRSGPRSADSTRTWSENSRSGSRRRTC